MPPDVGRAKKLAFKEMCDDIDKQLDSNQPAKSKVRYFISGENCCMLKFRFFSKEVKVNAVT